MQVDPRFRQMGQTARRRRRKSAALRGGVAGLAAVALGGVIWWQFAPRIETLWTRLTGDDQMVQVEAEFDIAPIRPGDSFTNIPGDPMIIPRLEQGEVAAGQTVMAPAALMNASLGGARGAELTVLNTDLRAPDQLLVAALPATREEFAMFQAERSRAMRAAEIASDQPPPAAAVSNPDQPAVSGTVFLREPAYRTPIWTDSLIKTTTPRSLSAILTENGLPAAEAARIAERMGASFNLPAQVQPGTLLAMRYRGEGASKQVIQLGLYQQGQYLGSMAMAASGQLVPAADAWADQQVVSETLAGEAGAEFQPQRLLDMIYSAALRSNLTPDQAGTALAMMSKIHDLDGFADPADRLTVIREKTAPGIAGQILFIGVSGPSGDKPCYMLDQKGADQAGPGCFTRRQVALPAGGPAALTPPIAGVMTQRFVPLPEGAARATGTDLLRGHVMWSAPQGSPVRAAAAGTVAAITNDPSFGPSVELAHPDGSTSRYRGLGTVSPALAQGSEIGAGTTLGTVGLPPGQKQPGLIFQLLEGGVPVDPSARLGGAAPSTGSGAVEALIGRIIQVESAGNARARNPLSTASGLGQFIESTWLRMIRSYRPDLLASMSRAEVLELRFNPDLSREMVRRLAQENEAYLRARGHDITAGRLYLAHFLGPAGADQALRADPANSVGAVMGAAVVSANPFLRSYSIADLRNWAERKMSGTRAAGAESSGGVIMADAPVSPEVRAFIAAIDQIRQAI
ncbi:peptidoglycan DD-metalloendopeptidase family protein [Paracoccus xiamenensis]|uniref:peptidoglycan DD-metalloendopeptidase family protein n=1 Tax=Paracoccus xiamenensis TaxID=2714901 RepID=UPI00140E7938|nr:peptidoglycan DD-metalloendopeptidase family protein [Paracoccus xiamenensis]NHF73848.1 peptidoglycan DD-metalloendopeptidase family protein [Paracoccus xiamenensis]